MTRPRKEIIDRIIACQKLADPLTNQNEHERESAKRAALELIRKHSVTAKELGQVTSSLNSPGDSGEGLGAVAEALKKSGFKPSRGWEQ